MAVKAGHKTAVHLVVPLWLRKLHSTDSSITTTNHYLQLHQNSIATHFLILTNLLIWGHLLYTKNQWSSSCGSVWPFKLSRGHLLHWPTFLRGKMTFTITVGQREISGCSISEFHLLVKVWASCEPSTGLNTHYHAWPLNVFIWLVVCVFACAVVSRYVETRGYWVPCSIALYFISLRRGLPLHLELSWHPASPGDLLVSTPNIAGAIGLPGHV